jgi:hypothetical protein
MCDHESDARLAARLMARARRGRTEAAVHTWTTIVSLPLCAALTAAGLVLSWFTWRRRGARRGIRLAAWSLLPLALYLTGAVPMLWRVGSAIATFAEGFVFSPKTWAGLALFALALVIFVVSGGLPVLSGGKRRAGKAELKRGAAADGAPPAAGEGTRAIAKPPATAAKPAKAGKQGKGDADGGLDDDVMEILRRRGIS